MWSFQFSSCMSVSSLSTCVAHVAFKNIALWKANIFLKIALIWLHTNIQESSFLWTTAHNPRMITHTEKWALILAWTTAGRKPIRCRNSSIQLLYCNPSLTCVCDVNPIRVEKVTASNSTFYLKRRLLISWWAEHPVSLPINTSGVQFPWVGRGDKTDL